MSWSSKQQPRSLDRALRLSIAPSPTPLLSANGCGTYFMSFSAASPRPPSPIATTSPLCMSANRVLHKCTKHIELDIHFVRERVQLGDLRVLHVPTGEQYADMMTKGLPTSMFQEFRSSLCVVPMTQQTVGGVEARRSACHICGWSAPSRRVCAVTARIAHVL